MRGVRFTKPERELLTMLLASPVVQGHAKWIKAANSALAKLEEAEMPVKKSTYLTTSQANEAFLEVLGSRLIVPPFGAYGVLGQMKRRIEALGLTRADCVTIAKVAGEQWRGPIRAESLVRQADKLLAESQGVLFSDCRGGTVSPVELSDDEI